MEYTFTSEDIKLVEKFIDIKNRGYYADGKQLTDAYNRILHKNANPTNCGSCIRQRITELEAALNHFKKAIENKASEPSKDVEVNNVTPDNNKASEEPKKRTGRPPKKS